MSHKGSKLSDVERLQRVIKMLREMVKLNSCPDHCLGCDAEWAEIQAYIESIIEQEHID